MSGLDFLPIPTHGDDDNGGGDIDHLFNPSLLTTDGDTIETNDMMRYPTQNMKSKNENNNRNLFPQEQFNNNEKNNNSMDIDENNENHNLNHNTIRIKNNENDQNNNINHQHENEQQQYHDSTQKEMIIEEEIEGGIVPMIYNNNNPGNENSFISSSQLNDNNNTISKDVSQSKNENQFDPSAPIYLNLSQMHEWSIQDVCNWLQNRFPTFGQQYISTFTNNQIVGKKLKSMNEEQLLQLQIENPCHRSRIYRDIMDSCRTFDTLKSLYVTSSSVDGGTISSRFMRFTNEDVCNFANLIQNLQPYCQIFQQSQINGLDLLNADENYLLSIGVSSWENARSILSCIWEIKTNIVDHFINKEVENVWKKRKNPHDTKYNLLPQHLIDWVAKSNQQMSIQQQTTQNNNNNNNMNQSFNNHNNEISPRALTKQDSLQSDDEQPLNVDGSRVLDWTTDDCVAWLDTFPGYRAKYEDHFRGVAMNGTRLLQMTPYGFEQYLGVEIKKHIREMIKNIDKLRDAVLQATFANTSEVKEWSKKQQFLARRRSSFKEKKHSNLNNLHVINTPSQVKAFQQQQQQQQQQQYAVMQHAQSIPRQHYSMPQQHPYNHLTPNDNMNNHENNNNDMMMNNAPNQPVPACIVCGTTGNVMRCSNCKQAFYCSRQHQLDDWKRHAEMCMHITSIQDQ